MGVDTLDFFAKNDTLSSTSTPTILSTDIDSPAQAPTTPNPTLFVSGITPAPVSKSNTMGTTNDKTTKYDSTTYSDSGSTIAWVVITISITAVIFLIVAFILFRKYFEKLKVSKWHDLVRSKQNNHNNYNAPLIKQTPIEMLTYHKNIGRKTRNKCNDDDVVRSINDFSQDKTCSGTTRDENIELIDYEPIQNINLNIINKYTETNEGPNYIDMVKYMNWKYEEIVEWIMSLDNGRFEQYKNILLENLKEEGIEGSDLCDVNEIDLKSWGVKNFKDKKLLLAKLKELTQQNIQNNFKGNNIKDEGAPTAYI
eukprot:250555_1